MKYKYIKPMVEQVDLLFDDVLLVSYNDETLNFDEEGIDEIW